MDDPKKPEIIHAKRDANGNVEVALYSRKFDVTALVKDGVAEARLIGKKYRILVEGEYKVKRKRKKKQAEAESE